MVDPSTMELTSFIIPVARKTSPAETRRTKRVGVSSFPAGQVKLRTFDRTIDARFISVCLVLMLGRSLRLPAAATLLKDATLATLLLPGYPARGALFGALRDLRKPGWGGAFR